MGCWGDYPRRAWNWRALGGKNPESKILKPQTIQRENREPCRPPRVETSFSTPRAVFLVITFLKLLLYAVSVA